MTATTETKRIYDTKAVAHMLAGKLSKKDGASYAVMPVSAGFQVVRINKLPAYMPPKIPTPVKKVDATAKSDNSKVVTLKLPFKGESKAYLETVKLDGVATWIGKTTVVAYSVSDDKQTMTIQIDRKQAKKKNLYELQVA